LVHQVEKSQTLKTTVRAKTHDKHHPGLYEAIMDGCGMPSWDEKAHGNQKECLVASAAGQETEKCEK